MKRETENVVLLLTGLCIGIIAFTGAYTRYVKPSLQPWLIVSAVLLIGLALAATIRDIRRGSAFTDHDHDHDHGDTHKHRTGIVWLLLLPIALLGFVVPPAIAPKAIPAVTEIPAADVEQTRFPTLPPGRAPDLPLPEVSARILNDTGGTLNGRLITVKGFTRTMLGQPLLARVTIMCCAADATLNVVRVAGPGAKQMAGYPDDTWVKVEGMAAARPPGTSRTEMPVLDVVRVERIPEPEYPYAYN